MSNSHTWRWLNQKREQWLSFAVAMLILLAPGAALAEPTAGAAFNIQVSPSPLAVTLRPGQQKTATITVRNFSTHAEVLHPRLNGFHIDSHSQKVSLDDNPPANLSEWVSFKQASLTLGPGTSLPLDIVYNTPTNVGFSYTAVITLSRGANAVPATGSKLQGTVAVFNLINIDRPDAKRTLGITSFQTNKGHYEFLPANLRMTIKNSGNIIDQPSGNIFIQRSFDDAKPIAAIQINPNSNYVLPGTSRTFSADWQNGFPLYVRGDGGKTHLSWDWHRANQLRFGRYVAKAVLVYNDGQRDVPVITSTTFWVIPWRLIGVTLFILIILIMGLFGWGKLIAKGTKKVKRYARRK